MTSLRPKKEKQPEKCAAGKLSEAGGMEHSEEKKNETNIKKVEDETVKGIRGRLHFEENAKP